MALQSHDTMHWFPPDRSSLRLQPPLRGYAEGFPTFAGTLERETQFHHSLKTLILSGGAHTFGLPSTLPSDKRPELAVCGLVKLLRPLRVLERLELLDLDFVDCPFAVDPSHTCEAPATFPTVLALVVNGICMRQPWSTDVATLPTLFPSLDTMVVGGCHYQSGRRKVPAARVHLQQPLQTLTVRASRWTDLHTYLSPSSRWMLWRLPLNRRTVDLDFVGATVDDLGLLSRLVAEDKLSLRRVKLGIAKQADGT